MCMTVEKLRSLAKRQITRYMADARFAENHLSREDAAHSLRIWEGIWAKLCDPMMLAPFESREVARALADEAVSTVIHREE